MPHAQGSEDVVGQVVLQRHARDALHHHAGEREAVVAVHVHRARGGLQVRVAQPGQDAVGVAGDRLGADAVGVVRSGQAGRVIEQHPDSDLLVLRRQHREVGDVPHDRGVERRPCLGPPTASRRSP